MNVAWRIKCGGEGVEQVGETKIVLTNTEFKEKMSYMWKYPEKNKSEDKKENKTFLSKCNHCDKVGHKDTNF